MIVALLFTPYSVFVSSLLLFNLDCNQLIVIALE